MLTIGLGGCGMLSHFISMKQYNKPFTAGNIGSQETIEFHVPTQRSVGVYLIFRNNKELYLDGKINDLLGDGGVESITLKRLNNGVPIPLSIKMRRSDTGEIIQNKTVHQLEYDGGSGNGVYKVITSAYLPRGNYSVTVVSLENVPAIQGMPIDLDVHAPAMK